MVIMRPMGEVESGYRHAGFQQLGTYLHAPGNGPERANDLQAPQPDQFAAKIKNVGYSTTVQTCTYESDTFVSVFTRVVSLSTILSLQLCSCRHQFKAEHLGLAHIGRCARQ
jgi:hypothetical protein